MEEAEELADKVLIMSQGNLLSEGTTHELKLKYGAGYVLHLECNEKVDTDALMRAVHKCIPESSWKVKLRPCVYSYCVHCYTVIEHQPAIG